MRCICSERVWHEPWMRCRLALRQPARPGLHREIEVVLGTEPLLHGDDEPLTGRDHHARGDDMKVCPRRTIEDVGARHAIEAETPAVVDGPVAWISIDQQSTNVFSSKGTANRSIGNNGVVGGTNR